MRKFFFLLRPFVFVLILLPAGLNAQITDPALLPEPADTVLLRSNGFTPQGESMDADLLLYATRGVKTMTTKVYNRWGVEIFSSDALIVRWDGKQKDKPVSEGVYYYVCELTLYDQNNTKKSVTGNFTMIR